MTATRLTPYLSFCDDATEEVDFSQGALGGDLTVSTFADYTTPESQISDDPAELEKVMHSALTTEGGLEIMAADTPNSMDVTPGTNFSISLSGDDEANSTGFWETLSEGGSVVISLMTAPWNDLFGMLTDTFGINWLVSITQETSAVTG